MGSVSLYLAFGMLLLTARSFGNIDVKFLRIIDGKKLDGFQSIYHTDVSEIQCMGVCSVNSKVCHSVNYHQESRRCVIKTDVVQEKVELQLKDEEGWKYLEKSQMVVSVYFCVLASTSFNEGNRQKLLLGQSYSIKIE